MQEGKQLVCGSAGGGGGGDVRRTIGLCMLERCGVARRCKLRSVSAEYPLSFDPSAGLDERHPASLAKEGGKGGEPGGRGGPPLFLPDKSALMLYKLFPLLHK